MNYKSYLLLAASCISLMSKAQEMNGFRTDNYNGVNGAFFNPANLANSPYKIDLNIIGVNIFAGNKSEKIGFSTFSDIGGDSSVLNDLVDNGKTNTILANVALHMPSISVKVNEKLNLAFLSRSRVLFDVYDFDGTLYNAIQKETEKGGFPYSINNGTNMRVNANVFSEFGLSAGYTVYQEGHHVLKAGATVKYIGGVSNAYLQLNKLNTTIDYDSISGNTYATNSSGSLAVGIGGTDLDKLNNASFNFKASGFGADLGLVYEYHPDNVAEDGPTNYLFKVGLAILDLGSVKYKVVKDYSAAYDIHIPAGSRFDLSSFDGSEIKDIKAVLDAHPQYFTPNAGSNNVSSYAVSLPRTLQINADYRALKNIYVSANAQLAMTNNTNKAYNPKSINSLCITPRYESRMLAAYLPISINNVSGANLGLGLRAGPFYAGSSSILSLSFGSAKQVDFYFGFRVGIKQKGKEKNKG